jgi:endo-1,4-beta-xylanase
MGHSFPEDPVTPGLSALNRTDVSAELHVYAGTGHGFGVRENNWLPVSDWPNLFLKWLDVQGFLQHK